MFGDSLCEIVINIWFLSHLSKPVHISWICSWHCYVYNEFRRQVCWWFSGEIVINIVMSYDDGISRD